MGFSNYCPRFTDIPVWYSNIDNVASFSDWSSVSFGRWTYPSMKQYQGVDILCDCYVGKNFYWKENSSISNKDKWKIILFLTNSIITN